MKYATYQTAVMQCWMG